VNPTRVFDLLRVQLERTPRRDALAHKVGGQWKTYSTAESLEIIDALAWGLHLAGIEKGDRIANITETNRPEWNFIDNAVMSLGAIHVPIYPNLNPTEFEFILNHSEAKLLFVSSESLYRLFTGMGNKLPSLEGLYIYDPVQDARSWTELRDLGREEMRETENRELLRRLREEVQPTDLATLIYTSGTTATPKGVMLSHANLVSNCLACSPMVQLLEVDRTLSFLPLCHVFERTMINIYINLGIGIYYAESLSKVGENLREVRPAYFSTVPRILEKIYESILAAGNQLPGLKRKIFDWAHQLALEYRHGTPIPWTKRLQHRLADRLVYRRWREALGGRVQAITCGSAPLRPRVTAVFFAAGIEVHEGYGLTEAAPVISANYGAAGKLNVGTVGPIIPGGQIKLTPDNEILYRGPNVMMGYYRSPELTRQTIDEDGWLHTGDVGEFEDDFLRITDRKKEMFKTSGGKYVSPQQLENKMKESKFVEQIVVVGEFRKYPAALIVPAFDEVTRHIRQFSSRRSLVADPEVSAFIQSEVDRLNQHFAHYMQIKKIRLLSEEWSVATGELTPTLKPKRRFILQKHAKEIDSLYPELEAKAASKH
jgi:long-chain acyl-CoA synthetase